MKCLSLFAVVISIVFAGPGVGSGAPLRWRGVFTVQVGATLPLATSTATGVATVNGSSGFGHLSQIRMGGGVDIQRTVAVPVTDPEATVSGIAAIGVTISRLRTRTLSSVSGGGGLNSGVLPIGGTARICLFDPACIPGSVLELELTSHAPTSSTIGIGVGGLITVGGAGMIRVSVLANPWTIGQATALDQTDNQGIVTVTATGFAHGPASLTSSTANPCGVLQLVTPLQVSANLGSGSNEVIALFGIVSMTYLPEPSSWLLLAAGIAGLLLLGRTRMRRRA